MGTHNKFDLRENISQVKFYLTSEADVLGVSQYQGGRYIAPMLGTDYGISKLSCTHITKMEHEAVILKSLFEFLKFYLFHQLE